MNKNLLFLAFVAVFSWFMNQSYFEDGASASLVTVQTSDNAYDFKVEVARTEKQKRIGLMNQDSLARFSGMLFINEPPRKVSMWMKNTLIPLDMIFIDEEGMITKIHRDAVPHSETNIVSNRPITAVLEVNGGLTTELNINEGDKVIYAD